MSEAWLQRPRLDRAVANVGELEQEAATVADRLAEVRRAAARHARRLAETADSAGLTRAGELAETGDDLQVTAKAGAAARRDDIREIRGHIGRVRDAERDRRGAETALGKAQQLLAEREQSCRDADDHLHGARAAIAQDLRSWAEPVERRPGPTPRSPPTRSTCWPASWTGSASRTCPL